MFSLSILGQHRLWGGKGIDELLQNARQHCKVHLCKMQTCPKELLLIDSHNSLASSSKMFPVDSESSCKIRSLSRTARKESSDESISRKDRFPVQCPQSLLTELCFVPQMMFQPYYIIALAMMRRKLSGLKKFVFWDPNAFHNQILSLPLHFLLLIYRCIATSHSPSIPYAAAA